MTALPRLNSALSGRYRVEREIGSGGMATVYLAMDLKHDRKVALKLLSPELGAVLGVERFLAEIRVTANLQHPNLLPLFDSGEADGMLFYVMPFVEGESLRARLQREKQLPIAEALHIATAVAGALNYAHQHGVIHRDLKPENILIQHGEPVVADFGIALAVSKAGGQRVTQTGISLGTPHYMSPEQATGDRQIDGRTDIYSLGAVLYEMLGGEPPHAGSTAQAVIARLLTERPRPVRAMRQTVPEHIEAAIDRALEKLPADRFATAQDFARALTDERGVVLPPGVRTPGSVERDVSVSFTLPTRALRGALPWVLVVALGGVALWGWMRRASSAGNTMRFSLVLPAGQRVAEAVLGTVFAMSPDGRRIAIISSDSIGGNFSLTVRTVDQLQTRVLEGTRGARNPAFSPDGQWVAFTVGQEVRKVAFDGGPVMTLGAAQGANANGLSWKVPETIVAGGTSLVAIPAVGGPAREIAQALRPDREGVLAYRWPLVLPDGETVVFTQWGTGGFNGTTLAVASLSTGKVEPLGIVGTSPLLVADGWLMYGNGSGAIMAVPFDARRKRITGNAVTVVQDVVIDQTGALKAAVSANGDLIYQSGLSITQPMVVDQKKHWSSAHPGSTRVLDAEVLAGRDARGLHDRSGAVHRRLGLRHRQGHALAPHNGRPEYATGMEPGRQAHCVPL